ncbi:hypothetical protein [Agrobacterium leguminum]
MIFVIFWSFIVKAACRERPGTIRPAFYCCRHLARLEEVIGGKLFAKRLNGLELSELGRHVIERALMIERDAAILEAMGRRNNELAAGSRNMLRRMVMPRLDQFFDNYAGIELPYLRSEASELNQNEADIALRLA